MSERENTSWKLEGEDASSVSPEARALAEHYLSETDGDALNALVSACLAIAVLRKAVSFGLVRSLGGEDEGVRALQVLARASEEARSAKGPS